MKSKIALETLRTQLQSSLDIFSRYSSTDEILVQYKLEENENIGLELDGENIKAYGLLLMVYQTTSERTKERRLWLRRYPITGSLNEVKYQAFKELFDVIIGNFIVNATRADNKTLEDLSNKKDE